MKDALAKDKRLYYKSLEKNIQVIPPRRNSTCSGLEDDFSESQRAMAG
jgi:hypothetical protein